MGNNKDDAYNDGVPVGTITFVMTGQYPGDDKRKGKSKETTNQFNYSPPSFVALNHFIIAWQKLELRRCNDLINSVLNQFWLCAVNYDRSFDVQECNQRTNRLITIVAK